MGFSFARQRQIDRGSFSGGKGAIQPPSTYWRDKVGARGRFAKKLNKMVGAKCYVGVVDGELVAHVAVSTMAGMIYSRASRLVVMPEWQGAGVGLRFLNEVCSMWTSGRNRFNKPLPTVFHTSHPGLCASLRRDVRWQQVSAILYGENKRRSIQTLMKSGHGSGGGFGGHFRPVQGFRFVGDA
jgi:GNAT superfamily N-acetyltransferase